MSECPYSDCPCQDSDAEYESRAERLKAAFAGTYVQDGPLVAFDMAAVREQLEAREMTRSAMDRGPDLGQLRDWSERARREREAAGLAAARAKAEQRQRDTEAILRAVARLTDVGVEEAEELMELAQRTLAEMDAEKEATNA